MATLTCAPDGTPLFVHSESTPCRCKLGLVHPFMHAEYTMISYLRYQPSANKWSQSWGPVPFF